MNLKAGSFEIRPIQLAELAAVLAVYRKCEDFLALGPQPQATLEMVQADMQASAAHGGVFCGIYRASGEMVGVVDYSPRLHDGNPAHAYISLLMIATEFRHQGLGAQVVHRIETEIASDPLILNVRTSVQVNNPDALRFWQRQGYVIVSGPEPQADQTIVYQLRKDLIWGDGDPQLQSAGKTQHPYSSNRKNSQRQRFMTAAFVIVVVAAVMIAALYTQLSPTSSDNPQKVDPYPLYVLQYDGDTDCASPSAYAAIPLRINPPENWACTLFAAYGDHGHAIAGRNFDWQFSPGLLLFTHPANGYASVTMVNLGFVRAGGVDLSALSSSELTTLMDQAASLPTDGMNEYGLAIGMAAVPDSAIPYDAGKPAIGSLCAIRTMLDHARTTDEAVHLLERYNVDFRGGPQIHYLIADPTGHSAVVEFTDGTIHVIRNDQPWQLATNFYLFGSTKTTLQGCWRYAMASKKLEQIAGVLAPIDGMNLLSQVAQSSNDYPTQWSIVYDMSTGEVLVTMGRHYDHTHKFVLPLRQDTT